jgi:hypothetical protein
VANPNIAHVLLYIFLNVIYVTALMVLGRAILRKLDELAHSAIDEPALAAIPSGRGRRGWGVLRVDWWRKVICHARVRKVACVALLGIAVALPLAFPVLLPGGVMAIAALMGVALPIVQFLWPSSAKAN